MIPPQLPGSPSYLRPGTPALAWFLRDLGYNTGEFGKNHLGDLGDHAAALPTAHGFHEFWGYLPPRPDAWFASFSRDDRATCTSGLLLMSGKLTPCIASRW